MRITIVGAGLAGLSAASLLARDGHRVEVLERAAKPQPIGAGLLLQPPGIAILDQIGGLKAVADDAARITRIEARTIGGRKLLDVDYAELSPTLHGLGLTRPAIWSALLDSASRAGAEISSGREVTALEKMDGYDLVVVAAGTHSSLWRSPIKHVSNLYGWGCLWATVPLPPDWRTHILQQRCRSARKMVGVLPLNRTFAALYWSVRNDRIADWRRQSMQQWVDELGSIYPEAAPLVAGLRREDLTHATYRDVWTDPPFHGRIVVIGDAAHGTSPQLGQGTTQAFRDALSLTEALRLDAPLADQLVAYWQARKSRTRYYRHASRWLTPLFQTDWPILGKLRDIFAGSVGAIPYVRRQSVLTVAGLKTGLFSDDWDGRN